MSLRSPGPLEDAERDPEDLIRWTAPSPAPRITRPDRAGAGRSPQTGERAHSRASREQRRPADASFRRMREHLVGRVRAAARCRPCGRTRAPRYRPLECHRPGMLEDDRCRRMPRPRSPCRRRLEWGDRPWEWGDLFLARRPPPQPALSVVRFFSTASAP
jgi:hypothetical protein